MASRLEPEKNIDLAIRAWTHVIQKSPDTGLIIVGRGSLTHHLHMLVNRLGLQSKVIFEPWIDMPTLISYYKTADIFLNTSFYEGYGLTLVEAHAAGCRIISTDVGVAREVGATIVGYDVESIVNSL